MIAVNGNAQMNDIPTIILGVSALIGIGGFIYLILVLQVSSSFPPFYESVIQEDEIRFLATFGWIVMVSLIFAVFLNYLFFLFGVTSVWLATRVRRFVKEQTDRPLPLLLNPITTKIFNRWPMLLFDAWTIGLTLFMCTFMFLG